MRHKILEEKNYWVTMLETAKANKWTNEKIAFDIISKLNEHHQSKVESVTDERERLKEFIRWNNQHNGIATPVPLKMADNYLERK